MGSDHKILTRIGRRISELRRESGMTQAALAEALDVTVKYIQQMEYGQVNIPVLTLSHLADAFGKDVSILFEPPTSEKPKPGRPTKA